jgi:hypothetical protein
MTTLHYAPSTRVNQLLSPRRSNCFDSISPVSCSAVPLTLDMIVHDILQLAGKDACNSDVLVQIAADYIRRGPAAHLDTEPLIPELGARLRHGATSEKEARQRQGAFYTPPMLVDFILDHTLAPWQAAHSPAIPTVLDPSCGTGRFLLAAGKRLVAARQAQTGECETTAWQHVGPGLLGLDSDPIATAWLSGRLTSLAGGEPAAAAGIRTEDALGAHGMSALEADIVVGNPPFGSPLKTASHAEAARVAARDFGGPTGRYTDLAAIFLGLAQKAVTKHGYLGMVQPLSVLAARDAAPIRTALLETCTLTAAWASSRHVFDASVYTCAVVFKRTPTTGHFRVERYRDLPVQPCHPILIRPTDDSWSPLATAAIGFPDLPLYQTTGTLGDFCEATADFRDQYYGLKPAIEECGNSIDADVVPVVTTGVLDAARCHWGQRPIRLLGQVWSRPGIRVPALSASMQSWAASRLVPKVMLPTQTRTLEPVLDTSGRWLPSVPIITITTKDPHDLPRIGAVLACPLISLLAVHRSLGTARNPKAIKLSARDVLTLPTPADTSAWDAGARSFRLAQDAETQIQCDQHLAECASHMSTAFGVNEAPGL